MVGRDLVERLPVARNIGEQHPARTAGQSIRNPDKLLTPAIDRTEVLRDGAREGVRQDAPVAAETCKIQFVQKCRIERHNLVALQAGKRLAGSIAEIELLDFLAEGVQAI